MLDDTFFGKGTFLILRSAAENIHTYPTRYWSKFSVLTISILLKFIFFEKKPQIWSCLSLRFDARYVCFPLLILRSEMFPSRRRYHLTAICPRDTYGSHLGLTWVGSVSLLQFVQVFFDSDYMHTTSTASTEYLNLISLKSS